MSSARRPRRTAALLALCSLGLAGWIVAQVAPPLPAAFGDADPVEDDGDFVSSEPEGGMGMGGGDGGGGAPDKPPRPDGGGVSPPPPDGGGGGGGGGGSSGGGARAPVTSAKTDPGATAPPPKGDADTARGKSSPTSSKASKARLAWLAAQPKARWVVLPARLLAAEERAWVEGVLASLRRTLSCAGPVEVRPASTN